jgi:putative ABC transport system permease protein
MSTIARGIVGTDPTALYDHGVAVTPLAAAVVGDVAHYLKLLMSAVLFVLLIVCANVAASALARAASRQHEMAIRTSLGAPRRRLVRQLLIEHVMLGVAGGIVGSFAAWVAVRAIVARWGNQIPRAEEIVLDGRIAAVAIIAALFAGISAGVIPALRATGVPPRASLAAGGRTSVSGGRNLAGASFVTIEIALAVLLPRLCSAVRCSPPIRRGATCIGIAWSMRTGRSPVCRLSASRSGFHSD